MPNIRCRFAGLKYCAVVKAPEAIGIRELRRCHCIDVIRLVSKTCGKSQVQCHIVLGLYNYMLPLLPCKLWYWAQDRVLPVVEGTACKALGHACPIRQFPATLCERPGIQHFISMESTSFFMVTHLQSFLHLALIAAAHNQEVQKAQRWHLM